MKDDRHRYNGMDYARLGKYGYIDGTYEAGSAPDECIESSPAQVVFWSFPYGKGQVQPWRRKLWQLQNNQDTE
ncbi:hypothetical protein C2I18_08135 [Paenibacillus sp. PK3_47]|uniref:hypothetical protein n=1 Tax=Paenibacillus sp. PK3_47 TaxID=2072642 RepID=UPI00201DF369|nr:hypothetical protein [Paenibacillus sp. PK3_47]UQZ33513.1 hypothetical protein C2I18_08135 [Paenibacillus sp. PK3_47]